MLNQKLSFFEVFMNASSKYQLIGIVLNRYINMSSVKEKEQRMFGSESG